MQLILQKATINIVAFFLLPTVFCLSLNANAQQGIDGDNISIKKTIEDDKPSTEEVEDREVEKKHLVYFTLGDEHNAPKKQDESQEIFDCSDKIYTVVELTGFPKGKHQISVLWSDPAQTVREHTKYDFRVREEDTRLWAWLSLSRGTGAGMLQWINPAAGMEDFIGIWEIEVKIDGKTLQKENFEVSC